MSLPLRVRYMHYVHDILGCLGMPDFSVILQRKAAPPAYHAMMRRVEGQKRGHLWVSKVFLKEPQAVVRHFTVHECLHLMLWDLRMILVAAEPYFKKNRKAMDSLEAVHGKVEEDLVDGLADAWAPMLPLPPRGVGVEITGL